MSSLGHVECPRSDAQSLFVLRFVFFQNKTSLKETVLFVFLGFSYFALFVLSWLVYPTLFCLCYRRLVVNVVNCLSRFVLFCPVLFFLLLCYCAIVCPTWFCLFACVLFFFLSFKLACTMAGKSKMELK